MVAPTPSPTSTTMDEVQAHRFMNRRVRAALLEGDAESDTRPLARLGTGTYAGIFVTIALLAVVGVFGVLRPGGSTAWQQPGAFIVESETGARYVLVDGTLHPVLNYSSAKLLLGPNLHVVTVSVRSLESAPHGAPIGIPMAPDSLPDAAHIVGVDWSVCAIGTAADGQRFRTTAFPGVSADGEPVGSDIGYLLRTSSDRTYLLWAGHAYEIGNQWIAASGYRTSSALPVDDAFVGALPAGQPIAPPTVAGLGERGPALAGSVEPVTVGSIFADRVNNYYVMTRSGLAAMTPLQAELLLADPRLTKAYGSSNPSPLPISQAQVADSTVRTLQNAGPGAAPPSTAPQLASLPPGQAQVCIRYPDGRPPEVVVGPAGATPTTAAGLVQLPTGSGALVAARPTPDTQGTTVYLVTDIGIRYPVADQRALEQLGLAQASVAQLPKELVALLPQGPLLDPAAVRMVG